MNNDNYNPSRNYIGEAIFNLIGGYVVWFIKGKRTDINDELKKKLRNALITIALWIIVLMIIFGVILIS